MSFNSPFFSSGSNTVTSPIATSALPVATASAAFARVRFTVLNLSVLIPAASKYLPYRRCALVPMFTATVFPIKSLAFVAVEDQNQSRRFPHCWIDQ